MYLMQELIYVNRRHIDYLIYLFDFVFTSHLVYLAYLIDKTKGKTSSEFCVIYLCTLKSFKAAAGAQWVREFAPQA